MVDKNIELFRSSSGKDIPVMFEAETVWVTQAQMAELFETTKQNIGSHINGIIKDGELVAESTVKDFFTVQIEGDRTVERKVKHYNLDMIISVGFRVNSKRGIQFRAWANQRLKDYMVKGYALDEQRLANNPNEFELLSEKINELRLNEKNMYKQLMGLFVTSRDYDSKSNYAHQFFGTVQNMFHYAVHQHTAAELIVERCDSHKPKLGQNGSGQLTLASATIAKNYLTEHELKQMGHLVSAFFAYAEFQYGRERPIYMKDWLEQLEAQFKIFDIPILKGAGTVTHKEVRHKVEQELNQYRVALLGPR